jgi:hypothetical protein
MSRVRKGKREERDLGRKIEERRGRGRPRRSYKDQVKIKVVSVNQKAGVR